MCKRSVGMEHLDAAAVIVGHGHGPVGAVGDVDSVAKLVGSRSIRSDMICERAVGVEHLDAVVAGVCHGNDPTGAEVDADRLLKLSITIHFIMQTSITGAVVVVVVVVISLQSDLMGECAVGMEH